MSKCPVSTCYFCFCLVFKDLISAFFSGNHYYIIIIICLSRKKITFFKIINFLSHKTWYYIIILQFKLKVKKYLKNVFNFCFIRTFLTIKKWKIILFKRMIFSIAIIYYLDHRWTNNLLIFHLLYLEFLAPWFSQ